LFSAAQAALLGISSSQLFRAARSGYLRRVRLGVYAVHGTPPSPWEPILAAALAAGPGAAISHSSAAAAHRFYCAPPCPGVPELTIDKPHGLRLSGVRTHRGGLADPEDVIVRYGVLVTSPARTLVDLAARLRPLILERSLDEALIARQVQIEQLAACLKRSPPHLPGRAAIQRLVDLRAEGPIADSVLEARAYRVLAAFGPFEVHHVVTIRGKTFVLDAAWPEHKVGVEIDGRAPRLASRSAFDRERRKLTYLAAAGWTIGHLTAAMPDREMLEAVGMLLPTEVAAVALRQGSAGGRADGPGRKRQRDAIAAARKIT
jgi:very-short-patch-repair endonuclease